MINEIFGGMPSYISTMFKKRPPKREPANAPSSARDTPEKKAELDRQFNALMSEVGTGADEPMPKESTGSAVGRGLAGFLGFVPKGGTQGDAVDGFANFGRALMGLKSVQQMESDYNDSIAPEKRRRALDTGDIETIKRIDPLEASRVQGVDETTYTGDRQRQLDEAVAAGDVDAMRRLDPEAADARDAARREAALRAARAARQIGSTDPTQGSAALARFAKEQPNLFSAQELQAHEQGGPDALEAMLTGESRSGKDRFLSVGGGIYDMDKETWVQPQTKELTEKENLELDVLRARIGQINRSNRGSGSGAGDDDEATGGFADPAVIQNNINNLSGAVERAKSAGAVRGGKDLNPLERFVAGAMAAPGAMDDPMTAGAYASVFPERFEALQDIRASVLPLVQSLRTLPGMDATRLADTEKEFARLMDVVVNPNASAEQIDASVNSFLMLFRDVANVPASAPAAPAKGAPAYTDAQKEARYQAWKRSQGQ